MATESKKGAKGREYHRAVSDLIATGEAPGEAIKQVAQRTGTTPSNVSNAFYRIQRQQFEGNGAPIRSHARSSSSNIAVPKDLEPLLDAIRKDRQSLSNNVDALIAWAQGQESKTQAAVGEAREAAIRQIREAAAGLR